MNTEQIIAYKNELLLLDWGESARSGMTVKFQIPGDFESNPFKHSATGKKTGKRYAAVLVEINDDETPVVQKKGGRLSKEAAGLCKREDFKDFVRGRVTHYVRHAEGENAAADYIRDRCCVTSRAELDHNPGPAQEFAHIKREFLEWSQ